MEFVIYKYHEKDFVLTFGSPSEPEGKSPLKILANHALLVTLGLTDMQLPSAMVMQVTHHKSEVQMRRDYRVYSHW